MDRRIPDDVTALAGLKYTCACGTTHRIHTRKVLIDHAAIKRLPDIIDELGLPKTAWILADDNTFAAAGERVRHVLRQAGVAVEHTILKAQGGYIGADEAYLAQARAGMWNRAGLVIGVGSGTINDLARMLIKDRRIPYVVVATAPSMNGYGSPISAFLENGIKVTIPSAPTDAIIADLDVLAAAPVEMAQAGFGDLLAKNTSNTDWFLAALVRNDYYCDLPVEIVRRATARTTQIASDIRRRTSETIKALTEGLIAGAFAMDAAGVTSPASGGEHLISHYLEMVAHLHDMQPPMHGQQVAVGTIIASTLYEVLRKIDTDKIDFEQLVEKYPDWPTQEAHVRQEHGDLVESVLPEVRKQHLGPDQYRDRLQTIRAAWPELCRHIDTHVLRADDIRSAYLAAGTPTKAGDINIDPALLRKAVRLAHHVRDRYTILHLIADLGLTDTLADQALTQAGVRG